MSTNKGLKYIVTQHGNMLGAVLFSAHDDHVEIARKIGLGANNIHSAGFFGEDNNLTYPIKYKAYGRSISLDVESHENDGGIICRDLSEKWYLRYMIYNRDGIKRVILWSILGLYPEEIIEKFHLDDSDVLSIGFFSDIDLLGNKACYGNCRLHADKPSLVNDVDFIVREMTIG